MCPPTKCRGMNCVASTVVPCFPVGPQHPLLCEAIIMARVTLRATSSLLYCKDNGAEGLLSSRTGQAFGRVFIPGVCSCSQCGSCL